MHLIVKEVTVWLGKSTPGDTITILALAFYALHILNTKL
jgi:hypothetical protein